MKLDGRPYNETYRITNLGGGSGIPVTNLSYQPWLPTLLTNLSYQPNLPTLVTNVSSTFWVISVPSKPGDQGELSSERREKKRRRILEEAELRLLQGVTPPMSTNYTVDG